MQDPKFNDPQDDSFVEPGASADDIARPRYGNIVAEDEEVSVADEVKKDEDARRGKRVPKK